MHYIAQGDKQFSRVRVGNNGQRQRTGKICISSHHILQIYISNPTQTWKITSFFFFFLRFIACWNKTVTNEHLLASLLDVKDVKKKWLEASWTCSDWQERNISRTSNERNNSSVVTCAIRIQVNRTNNNFKATSRVYSLTPGHSVFISWYQKETKVVPVLQKSDSAYLS